MAQLAEAGNAERASWRSSPRRERGARVMAQLAEAGARIRGSRVRRRVPASPLPPSPVEPVAGRVRDEDGASLARESGAALVVCRGSRPR